MVQEKIKCYADYSQQPEQYFRCIDGVDEVMRKNSSMLQQKFGTVDVIKHESWIFEIFR